VCEGKKRGGGKLFEERRTSYQRTWEPFLALTFPAGSFAGTFKWKKKKRGVAGNFPLFVGEIIGSLV